MRWAVPGMVGLAVCAVVAAACDPSAASSAATPPVRGSLAVEVRSVSATLTPYNPMDASAGVPAEQVDFAVARPPAGSFVVCEIQVRRSDKAVGSTRLSANPPAGHSAWFPLSVPVSITGDTFAGKPSDARVRCRVSATGRIGR